MGHFAHGGLLTAGLFAIVIMAANVLEGRGTGQHAVLIAAHAAETARHEAVAMSENALDVDLGLPGVEPESVGRPVLSSEMARVKSYVARRYRVSAVALEPLLAEAETAGAKYGLDPLLLVAMIAIESSFNPFAESQVGAQGLMQVIPRFHQDKIGEGAGEDALFDPRLNIRVGAQVLKEGLKRYGTLQSALQYYGGALQDPAAGYANKVMSMKARLKSAAGPRKTA
ncbi:MAG: transglycosylase SLT domain-containing protein [Rhodocyclaceae bacterium]|nr:transglycosylase SLT domain-containing protein [Rhodocyclaceae bacterium]